MNDSRFVSSVTVMGAKRTDDGMYFNRPYSTAIMNKLLRDLHVT